MTRRSRPVARAAVAAAFLIGTLTASAASAVDRSAAARREAHEMIDAGRISEAATRLVAASDELTASGLDRAALELLDEAIEVGGPTPGRLARLGRLQLLTGDYGAAEASLVTALDEGAERSPRLLVDLATVLWNLERLDESEELLLEAAAVEGGAGEAAHRLGRLLLWRGRFEEAARRLEAVVGAQPGSFAAWLDLGRAREGAGDAPGALAAFRSALELQPGSVEATYGLARGLQRAGRMDEAAAAFADYARRVAERDERARREGMLAAQVEAGRALLREGRAEEAVRHLAGLDETADSLAALGMAQWAVGDTDAAVATAGRALALAPDREDLRELVRRVLEADG